MVERHSLAVYNYALEKVNEKSEKYQEFYYRSGVLFPRLVCCDTKLNFKTHTNVCLFT